MPPPQPPGYCYLHGTVAQTVGERPDVPVDSRKETPMSMLQEFFVFLSDLFQETDGQLDPALIKQRMTEEGFEDVTAYDVQEAVALMYEEGDVFDSDQSSVLNAYTGGNYVDQSFDGSNIGVATSGNAGGQATGSSAPAAQGGHAPASYSAPQPPPMDPAEGYTNLDAAVQQIVYVSNITNNTTINDQDTFEGQRHRCRLVGEPDHPGRRRRHPGLRHHGRRTGGDRRRCRQQRRRLQPGHRRQRGRHRRRHQRHQPRARRRRGHRR